MPPESFLTLSTLPPTIDPSAAARWAQSQPAESAWLHEEVARRMEARLQWMTQRPQTWVHWEPMRGGVLAHGLLQTRYPNAQCHAIQAHPQIATPLQRLITPNWWAPARWHGPSLKMGAPLKPVQMLWANMALHMAADPQAMIAQWHALLEDNGFLMFSCFGPDTLKELRAVYAAEGWPPASHSFTDMHDWGDMLVAAGFAQPVVDMEHINLSFSTPELLLAELRGLGRNLHPHRFPGLRGKHWYQRLRQAMQRLRQAQDGRLALSFEVIYGHAFKVQRRAPVSANTIISLDEMRSNLRQIKTKGKSL